MKTSRDLMLLAAVAFKNGKYDDAGALFAASLSADDSDTMLESLNSLGNEDAEPLNIESVSSSSEVSLSEIVASISNAIGDHQAATASSEDDSEETPDEEDEDEEDEADEEEEDEEEDTDSATASSNAPRIVRRPAGEHTLVIQANSPIKLRA